MFPLLSPSAVKDVESRASASFKKESVVGTEDQLYCGHTHFADQVELEYIPSGFLGKEIFPSSRVPSSHFPEHFSGGAEEEDSEKLDPLDDADACWKVQIKHAG